MEDFFEPQQPAFQFSWAHATKAGRSPLELLAIPEEDYALAERILRNPDTKVYTYSEPEDGDPAIVALLLQGDRVLCVAVSPAFGLCIRGDLLLPVTVRKFDRGFDVSLALYALSRSSHTLREFDLALQRRRSCMGVCVGTQPNRSVLVVAEDERDAALGFLGVFVSEYRALQYEHSLALLVFNRNSSATEAQHCAEFPELRQLIALLRAEPSGKKAAWAFSHFGHRVELEALLGSQKLKKAKSVLLFAGNPEEPITAEDVSAIFSKTQATIVLAVQTAFQAEPVRVEPEDASPTEKEETFVPRDEGEFPRRPPVQKRRFGRPQTLPPGDRPSAAGTQLQPVTSQGIMEAPAADQMTVSGAHGQAEEGEKKAPQTAIQLDPEGEEVLEVCDAGEKPAGTEGLQRETEAKSDEYLFQEAQEAREPDVEEMETENGNGNGGGKYSCALFYRQTERSFLVPVPPAELQAGVAGDEDFAAYLRTLIVNAAAAGLCSSQALAERRSRVRKFLDVKLQNAFKKIRVEFAK